MNKYNTVMRVTCLCTHTGLYYHLYQQGMHGFISLRLPSVIPLIIKNLAVLWAYLVFQETKMKYDCTCTTTILFYKGYGFITILHNNVCMPTQTPDLVLMHNTLKYSVSFINNHCCTNINFVDAWFFFPCYPCRWNVSYYVLTRYQQKTCALGTASNYLIFTNIKKWEIKGFTIPQILISLSY